LLSQKGLRSGAVFDPDKTVIALMVSDPGLIHLPSQPLAAIEANVEAEGKPGLDPYIQLTKLGVLVVMIEVGALGMFQHQSQLLGLTIPSQLKA
jgi:hypothetical protein